ncbi:MAG TPA: tetratricopeptide repeat protein, partial [Lentzea sp.]
TDERHRAILHQGLGALAFYRDRYGEARDHFARAQEIFAGTDEHRGHAYAHLGLGSVHLFHGRQDEAAVELGQARETFSVCHDESGEAFALQALGIVHRNQGRQDEAAQCLGQALEIFRRLGSRYGQACALFSLGLHHKARGDLAQTERALLDAVELFASCPRDEALALHVLAATYAEQGDAGRASEMMSRSLTVFSPEDESVGKAATLYSLGWVAHRNQRAGEAVACFEQALQLFRRLDMQVHVGRTVTALRQLGLTVPDRRS